MMVLVVGRGLLVGALGIVLVQALRRRRALEARYAGIIDVERERQRIDEQLARDQRRVAGQLARARREAEHALAQERHQATEALARERWELAAEVATLQQERIALEALHTARRRKLDAEYRAQHAIHARLQHEVALLQDSLEDLSYGHYKPHHDFDSPAQYKAALERVWQQQKDLLKADQATHCPVQWTVGDSKAEGRKLQKQQAKLMLRAFNGETEAAVARVSWSNIAKMEERIRKAFDAVNGLGTVMHVEITRPYLELALDELRLTHEHEQKKQEILEEQRRIKEQLREEELAQREATRAQEDAEKEELRHEKALAKARSELDRARGDELSALTARIAELQQSLAGAQQQKERARSMAELTRSGHVYVISNIGSFGERVYKIGMTRRPNPLDRVKELGDASVPFEFDVHALIPTSDAPALERSFHQHFSAHRVNLLNQRKEFFEVSIDQIEEFVTRRGLSIEVTKLAGAREYRQTLAMRSERPAVPNAGPSTAAHSAAHGAPADDRSAAAARFTVAAAADHSAAPASAAPFPTTLPRLADGSGATSLTSPPDRSEHAPARE